MLGASARDYLLLALGSSFLALSASFVPFVELKSIFDSKSQLNRALSILSVVGYLVGASCTFIFLKVQTPASMSLSKKAVLISLVALAALPTADRLIAWLDRSAGSSRAKSVWVINLVGGVSSAFLTLLAIVTLQDNASSALLLALLTVPLIVSVASAVSHFSRIIAVKTPWMRTGLFLASLGLLGLSSSAISSNTSFALGGAQPEALAKVSSQQNLPTTNRQVSNISASQAAGLSSYYLSFKGVEIVSKPNFHQIVRVRFFGSLDNGRGGKVHIFAWGVPQPDGSLALHGSNTLAQISQIKLNGVGPVRLFTARAVRGTLLFPGNRYYDYLLSYTPTGETTVKGKFVLYPRHGGQQTSSLV
ncbi:MAG: hypothetical protein HKL81_05325 [Acidimicrobiaceae bacterium]|nr:hypothetical protein [Acidimicrobiaceae bacterium]